MGRQFSPSVLAVTAATFFVTGCAAGHRGQGPAGVSGIDGGGWESPLSRDHPLVGRIQDVAGDREVTAKELAAALAGAEIVLLGEQHDNVDHHRLQARVLQDMIAEGRRPAVAFEQLDVEKQAAVDAVLSKPAAGEDESPSARATALAEAVDWKKSGWPPFDEYRPVFETALGGELPIRAANLSRAAMGHVLAHTTAGAKNGRAGRVDATHDVELTAEARASLAADIKESHCGYADDRMTAMMIEAQRRRDETMAGAVVKALAESGPGGVVLISGFGHARSDYGVPIHLRRREPGRRVVSVAFLEVFPGLDSPGAYADALHAPRLPFDYVVFTPRADGEDPCEKFRAGLEKMKAR